MNRRTFVASVVASGLAAPAVFAQQDHEHRHPRVTGDGATATVSFGAWPQGLDRLNPPMGPAPNVHQLIPYVTTIKVGGTVNFIVAGLHNIAVYAPGTRPEDIDASLLIPIPGAPPNLPRLIDDPQNRVFRGAMPLPPVLDRTEVVQFPKRGLHLVICAVLPHFEDRMWGWVRVVR